MDLSMRTEMIYHLHRRTYLSNTTVLFLTKETSIRHFLVKQRNEFVKIVENGKKILTLNCHYNIIIADILIYRFALGS